MQASQEPRKAGEWWRDRTLLRDVLVWDVDSWAFALRAWEPFTQDIRGARVLDVGARDGGLSLYFALRGCEVICSDLHGPADTAAELHRRYGVAERVRYAEIDATRIDLADNEMDIVTFKSVLGGVGRDDHYEKQRAAVREMHRVLRPGGMLLFAENMRGTALHTLLRRLFVSWGGQWRYLSVPEVREALGIFRRTSLSYAGVLATFGRTERQRSLLHGIDVLLHPLLPNRWKYIVAGCAIK